MPSVEKNLKRVREMLAKHVVESITPTTLVFREPGTGNCRMRFDIIDERNLVVTGDLGDAIYAWSGKVHFRWLSRLDLHYFLGKCQASEVGREFRQWDGQTARETIDRHVAEIDDLERRRRAQELLHNEHGYSALESSQHEWARWADDNWREICEDMDGMWELGMVPHIRAICHLEGLKMAMAMVPEEQPA